MVPRVQISRQQQAAKAHAAHVDPQQHAQRDRRRSDGQLKELKPDDFVNEGRAAGSDKQQQERRKPALSRLGAGCRPRGLFEWLVTRGYYQTRPG